MTLTVKIGGAVPVTIGLSPVLEKLLVALTDKFAAALAEIPEVKQAVADLSAKVDAHMAAHGDSAVLDGQADALAAGLQSLKADVAAVSAKFDPPPPAQG